MAELTLREVAREYDGLADAFWRRSGSTSGAGCGLARTYMMEPSVLAGVPVTPEVRRRVLALIREGHRRMRELLDAWERERDAAPARPTNGIDAGPIIIEPKPGEHAQWQHDGTPPGPPAPPRVLGWKPVA